MDDEVATAREYSSQESFDASEARQDDPPFKSQANVVIFMYLEQFCLHSRVYWYQGAEITVCLNQNSFNYEAHVDCSVKSALLCEIDPPSKIFWYFAWLGDY